MCCSTLQYVAVRCSMLQYPALCCSVCCAWWTSECRAQWGYVCIKQPCISTKEPYLYLVCVCVCLCLCICVCEGAGAILQRARELDPLMAQQLIAGMSCHAHDYAATQCTCTTTLQHAATRCNTLQHSRSLQLFRFTCMIMLQYTAPHCDRLQHTATHCNTLQHCRSF